MTFQRNNDGTLVVEEVESAAGAASRSRASAVIAVVAMGIVLVPFIAAVASRVGRPWFPTGDFAVIDARVRDVFSTATPLTGPYSRYGWNHPGPLMYQAIAPVSAVSGGASWATIVGAVLIHVVGVMGAVWAGWRLRGAVGALAISAVVALSYAAVGPWMVLEPWNPHVAYPFVVTFIVLLWGTAEGHSRWLPATALCGSFLVQCHVGYVPIVILGFGWLVAVVMIDHRRGESSWSTWRWPGLTALLLTVAVWFTALYDQFTSDPGNLGQILQWFGSDRVADRAGVHTAAGIFASEFRFLPPWLGGSPEPVGNKGQALPSSVWWLVPIAIAVAVGLVIAHRRGDRSMVRLIMLCSLLVLAGVAGVSRATDVLLPYLFYWRLPLAVALTGVVVAILASSAPNRGTASRRVAIVGLVVVIAIASLDSTLALISHPQEVRARESLFKGLVSVALDTPEARRPLLLNATGYGLDLHGATFNELVRRDRPVRVDSDYEFKFGAGRGAVPHDVASRWLVIEEGIWRSQVLLEDSARVLASTSPLTSNEERELTLLQQRMAAALHELGKDETIQSLDSPLAALVLAELPRLPGIDKIDIDRLTAFNRTVAASGGCRCAIIAVDPSADLRVPIKPG